VSRPDAAPAARADGTIRPQKPLPAGFFRPAQVSTTARPQLVVVVDTEEEFNWGAPFSREAVGVTAIGEVGRLQRVLGRYRVVPTYVIDYPVAATESSSEQLREIAHRGECHIGAHLHPWVNPPFIEKLGRRASYPCNLGYDLEREKLQRLTETIEERLGIRPRSYKAGRYGFARTTAQVLEGLGFDVDVSVNPHMNFSRDGGPSFEGFSVSPGWFGERRRLLEVPCTHGFIGVARRGGPLLHRAASAKWLTPVRAVGALAKAGVLNKVMLSPEGSTFAEMRALTDTLLRDGVRTFALTFHSPSLKPACTPYVRSEADRDAFLATIDRYCDDFLGRIGGRPQTPADLYDELCASETGTQTEPRARTNSRTA
jgi:hypothetical protein